MNSSCVLVILRFGAVAGHLLPALTAGTLVLRSLDGLCVQDRLQRFWSAASFGEYAAGIDERDRVVRSMIFQFLYTGDIASA